MHGGACATSARRDRRARSLGWYPAGMVRRDDVGFLAREGGYAASCRELPAGASPASVTAGEPSSRPAARGEILAAEAGRRKRVRQRELLSSEQARGPQLHVKSAASTEEQSEGRAAHVTAKAVTPSLVPERDGVLGGVRDAARVQGSSGNTRGPSAPPVVRQGGSNKSRTKSSAAQRESEGRVVPTTTAQNNAVRGKGPCFGHVRSEGMREGMARGPNFPGTRSRAVQVQQLQRELWVEAKRSPTVIVHASPRRPSVSRVLEICTHGLKGGSALSLMTTVRK
jgi:hypothetical protein